MGKLLRASVIITAALMVMQTLGFSISGVLAFGGGRRMIDYHPRALSRAGNTTYTLWLERNFLKLYEDRGGFVHGEREVANGLLATGDFNLRESLIQSGYDLDPQDARVESSPKQRWIVILSLLVCVVGIVNAQLMSVTERFREIGTMKCLGALDRFILRLFLLEAGMQGLVGAGAGALGGAAVALLGNLLRFGTRALTTPAGGEILLSVAFATGVGCLLSVLGVLYPAFVAARMQPVEAMRVEQ